MILALLIAAFAGIIVLGYVLLGWLDRFFDKGGFLPEVHKESELLQKDILIYGEEKEVGALYLAMTAAGFSCDVYKETGNHAKYHWVCAVSQDDANNLVFCAAEKRKGHSGLTMALCNQSIYHNLYVQKGVNVVLSCLDAAQIINMIKGAAADEIRR